MKIRLGFVSNSSTTSFAIVGRVFSVDDATDIALKNPLDFDVIKEDEEVRIETKGIFTIEWLGDGGEECVIGVDVKNARIDDIKNAFKAVEKLFDPINKGDIRLLSGYTDMGGNTGLE